jgi:uncharacterized membrane protein YhaH (DUF805 family)
MKNILSLLFSFSGRTTRLTWWITAVAWWLFLAVAAHIDTAVRGDKGDASSVFTILVFFSFWPLLAIQVKRWHDRNKSALWVLINFIPILGGLWTFIELGFFGPVNEGNEY